MASYSSGVIFLGPGTIYLFEGKYSLLSKKSVDSFCPKYFDLFLILILVSFTNKTSMTSWLFLGIILL